MKKVIFSLIIMMVAGIFAANSQGTKNDPVLLRIGDRTVTRSEFEAVYRKNNVEMEVADPKSVEEYLELYINFNLKVLEAVSLGMDTNPSFLTELNSYREQLARPYFNDPNVAEHVVEEAYERMQFDVRVSHILVSVAKDASPADTLEAYRKISDIRERARAGESFAELARTYSDDPSAKDTPGEDGRPPRKGNAGNLGYFTVFNMVYPFESAAYNTPVGEISVPVRSDFGYHILKVHDKLPAMGTARVAHIMVLTPADGSDEDKVQAEEKIRALYGRYLEGEDFAELARQYSEDHNSASRGGEMQAFTTGRMVPEFISAIHMLTDSGDVSEPVQSQFGWHIIKLIEKTPPGSYEDEYASLKSRVSRDVRGQLSRKAVIDRLKKEYKLRDYQANLKPFYTMVDDSIFRAAWKPDDAVKLNKRLLKFSSETYTQKDFADYLVEKQAHRAPQEIQSYIDNMFRSFTEDKLLAYEDARLETKYPEFRRLMKEYHDGILLFELTDKMVWTKALTDTAGLEAFYHANQDRYMGGERLDATIFSFQDEDDAIASKVLMADLVRNGADDDTILAALKDDHGKQVRKQHGRFSRGDHPAIDEVIRQAGIRGPVQNAEQYLLIRVHEVIPPGPKAMHEIRGLLISDYQQYLEEKWVRELRDKNEVYIDLSVLKQIQQMTGK